MISKDRCPKCKGWQVYAEHSLYTDKSCDSCKFETKGIHEEPCKNCKCSYTNKWEAKR